MYGESARRRSPQASCEGLSPRVRGIRPGPGADTILRGSIPACTGNPPGRPASGRRVAVYPRVYGESAHYCRRRRLLAGLSPRVRGILGVLARRQTVSRSIPACTGNPDGRYRRLSATRVYPRVYGESLWSSASRTRRRGLSPRVRGIHIARHVFGHRRRSIPACTGNPGQRTVGRRWREVYPRVYGESLKPNPCSKPTSGLSPRVRGIRGAGRGYAGRRGSIPACTGNPRHRRSSARSPAVYPRVYGESGSPPHVPRLRWGLSPRVRGILLEVHLGLVGVRSIPACTGNPPDCCPRTH